jgi:hypothetical protein
VEYFSGDCEAEHAEEISDHHGMVQLQQDKLMLQSGEQYAVYDFYFHVDAEKTATSNLVFEVQVSLLYRTAPYIGQRSSCSPPRALCRV